MVLTGIGAFVRSGARLDRRASVARLLLGLVVGVSLSGAEVESELIFPLEPWHNHSSSVVETPEGGLLAVWFHGSGERTADDVEILGARLRPGDAIWSPTFAVVDTPGFPDTNVTLFVDRQGRLWMFWMTFVANLPESTILQYRVSSDWGGDGPPRWERQHLLLLKHDLDAFQQAVEDYARPLMGDASAERRAYLERLIANAGDKYKSRMGWMVRTHPQQLPSGRILVGLYSDLYDFGLTAISDDEGATWRPSLPMIGGGGVQPSIVRRDDGTLVSWFRDNGGEPKRVLRSESTDDGETWTVNEDVDRMPNPGSSVETIRLASGEWLMVANDTEKGRHSLAVLLSEDEGRTWPWKRHLESVAEGEGSFSYPSVIQARDGTIHVTYSYHLPGPRKSIKHARFGAEWAKGR